MISFPHTIYLVCRLQAFLPYRDHFGMDMDAQRWMWVVTLPTSHPEAMHPALLNAICVIGCSLDPSIPKSWERHFYASAREQMQLSLSLCDRIEDWLYTVAILIGYLLLRGRPRGVSTIGLPGVSPIIESLIVVNNRWWNSVMVCHPSSRSSDIITYLLIFACSNSRHTNRCCL